MDVDEHQQPAVAAAPEGMATTEAASTDMTYFGRLAREIEPDLQEEDDGDYEDESMDEESIDYASWIDIEFGYDSYDDDDDDSVIELKEGGYQSKVAPRVDLSEVAKATLLWRLDKDESFSDWSIQVTASSGSKEVYHVHRSALAAGPNKSGYFDSLFRTDRFRECTNKTSKFEFPSNVASCFPAFLNYLYCPPNECQYIIDRENWYSLDYLANFFEVPKLAKAANDFAKDALRDLDHLLDCISAHLGSEDSVSKLFLSRVVTACAEMILSVKEDSSLLDYLSPAMYLQMLQLVKRSFRISDIPLGSDVDEARCHIFHLNVVYFRTHFDVLNENENYWWFLASPFILPNETKLAGIAAIDALQIMKLTGYDLKSMVSMKDYVSAVSKYLAAGSQVNISEISNVTSKMPQEAVNMLIAEFGSKMPQDQVNTLIAELISKSQE